MVYRGRPTQLDNLGLLLTIDPRGILTAYQKQSRQCALASCLPGFVCRSLSCSVGCHSLANFKKGKKKKISETPEVHSPMEERVEDPDQPTGYQVYWTLFSFSSVFQHSNFHLRQQKNNSFFSFFSVN